MTYGDSEEYEDLSTVISTTGVDFTVDEIREHILPRMREAGFKGIIIDKGRKEVTCHDSGGNFRQFYYE